MIVTITSLLTYLSVAVTTIVVNVVPALAPPTWLVLALYKINHPYLDILGLAIFGVIGSVVGRYLMYKYSQFFGKYVPKKEVDNLRYFRKFVGETDPRVFIETFLFSLSPLPSNFLFISFGLSSINITPVLFGFALGRLLSYTFLIDASFRSFAYLSASFGGTEVRIAADVLGLLFAIAIIFIRWKKVYISAHGWKLRLKKLFA